MNPINQDEFNELVAQNNERGIHISLFMPLEREPDKHQMNQIRFKNLLKEIEEKFESPDFLAGRYTKQDTDPLLQSIKTALNGRIAPEQGRSLAIFQSPGFQRIYRLPIFLEEEVVCGERFYFKPLLPLLNSYDRFYLLSLSQNQVQLWHGTKFSLEPVEVPNLPQDMAEALALEDPEQRGLNFRANPVGRDGRSHAAMFHGHEAEKEKKGAIVRYFREIDAAVAGLLSDEKAPLLVASVAYLLPLYQEANTYPHLWDEVIPGSPELLNSKDLHEQANAMIQPHFEQTRLTAVANYENAQNSGLASDDLAEIVFAAHTGRVDTLFIPPSEPQWGMFDPETGEVELCETAVIQCEDLLNRAATDTVANGGTVFPLPPEEIPQKASAAALFRYAV